jgi:ATP-dependent Lon protease
MNEIDFAETQPTQVDEIPDELPVLPLKETVVFPDSMAPLAIGQERSIRLVDDVVAGERLLALVTVRDAEVEAPDWRHLYEIGTAAVVHKTIRVPDGTLRILVQGLRRQIAEHGLDPGRIEIGEPVLRVLAREYTREAGVRGLERRIGDLCRKAAVQAARGSEEQIRVTEDLARDWLGPRRFSAETRRRTADPGVATGLAHTPVGGDVLYIEAQAYPGRGKLTVTGQLGEVMQESAQAALSWVRSHTAELELDEHWFSRHDVHLHVPAGSVPKDGPSAGVAMATAIASLVRETAVADDVAMTGEVTLTGQVLPIGGVRDKVLAAQRAGLGRVILPRENAHDLEELPAETRDALRFVLVDSIDEVFDAAFNSNGGAESGRVRAAAAQG